MKLPRLRTILLAPVALFALVYVAGLITVALYDRSVPPRAPPANSDDEPADAENQDLAVSAFRGWFALRVCR
jgi:hypothetical protein